LAIQASDPVAGEGDAPGPALPGDSERAMLRDAVRGLLAADWTAGEATTAPSPERCDSIWRAFARQGLFELGTDPATGGLREILIVQQELGRAACPIPFLTTALLHLAGIAPASLIAAAATKVTPQLALSLATSGAQDGDGQIALADGKLTGELAAVEGATTATAFAVLLDGPKLAIVKAGAKGLTVDPQQAMGSERIGRVSFAATPATLVAIDGTAAGDLAALLRLGLAARAFGAAQRGFELAVAYATERKQFGQPIGRFQAIQHKLANSHISLHGSELALANAAHQYDIGNAAWRWFAAAASAQAAACLRQVALETQHTFGAIGYSEDHEAPRLFRRVHLDVLRHDALRSSREMLAAHFLDHPAAAFHQYDLGRAGNAFRLEVRAWLAGYWSGERKAAFDRLPFRQREYDREFARAIGQTGWIGLSWPRRFGGQHRGAFEQLAFMEEMERVDAPRVGAPVQAAMLQVYGTPAQQRRYLPEIQRGEAIYGMGYSEPNSGSDLASLRTRAVRDGDHYVINGQKIWTTTYWGEYMLLATRTEPDAQPAHAGISMFIVPMDTPGITIRTSETMYGGTFANIFYDDVRVPADAMVGSLNDGWRVLTGALATERGFIGGGIVLKVARAFEELCGYLRGTTRHGKPMKDDPLVRDRIGDFAARIEAGRQMMVDCVAKVDAGQTPPEDAATCKVYAGELMEQFGEMALDLIGIEATLSQGSPGAILNGRIEQNLRHSLMWVISIGTNEIQRSLIAQRGLGLPR